VLEQRFQDQSLSGDDRVSALETEVRYACKSTCICIKCRVFELNYFTVKLVQ
jgi:hypothetical protein